jgi:23S rRNA (cytidine2498-2'-O)-methyltransferase
LVRSAVVKRLRKLGVNRIVRDDVPIRTAPRPTNVTRASSIPDQANFDSPERFDDRVSLLQVALVDLDMSYASLNGPDELFSFRRQMSPFRAGRFDLVDDSNAPSRAFQKLVETLATLGRTIARGERCLDLGASPGGWTYVAVRRGGYVTAVDRAELRRDLAEHPQVRFERRDGFDWDAERRFDWLLCDMAAFPERIVELLQEVLKPDRCRGFVVTVKFRGRGDDSILETIKRAVALRADEYYVRRLNANKNEATVFGYLRRDDPPGRAIDS